MFYVIVTITAFFIDLLIGDPRSKFHPVVLMGNAISILEKLLYNEVDSNNKKLFKGSVLVAVMILVSYVSGLIIVIYQQ